MVLMYPASHSPPSTLFKLPYRSALKLFHSAQFNLVYKVLTRVCAISTVLTDMDSSEFKAVLIREKISRFHEISEPVDVLTNIILTTGVRIYV